MPLATSRCMNCTVIMAMAGVLIACGAAPALANPDWRTAFFSAYSSANGTRLATLPSHANHCGVCHYNFGGGGTRNLYGQRLYQIRNSFPSTVAGKTQAVLSIANEDSDADGFTNVTEITGGAAYANTPTFPGLTSSNVASVSNVLMSDLSGYLTPVPLPDVTPPNVTVIQPNGGQVFAVGTITSVEWTATDENGVSTVSVALSLDDGMTFSPVASGLSNTGTYSWEVPNAPTMAARIRVTATDPSSNSGSDTSDAVFTIRSPLGDMNCDGLVNNFDIGPFVLALTDASAYGLVYPGCSVLNGDVSHDGALNNFDIDPFVNCILNLPPVGQGCP